MSTWTCFSGTRWLGSTLTWTQSSCLDISGSSEKLQILRCKESDIQLPDREHMRTQLIVDRLPDSEWQSPAGIQMIESYCRGLEFVG